MTTPLNILITGSNSGFGRLMSETLARAGHRVFASMRELKTRNAGPAEEMRNFKAESGGSIVPIEIDVTSDASVEHGVAAVLEQTGGRIDVAINNAGLGTLGLQEGYTPAQIEALFNLNVFGPHRIDRAVLPGMRARGDGILIHITSCIGRTVIPGMGPYCATKYALEAIAEAYRYELAPLGIDALIVEPGAFPTPFVAKIMTPADSSRAPGYGPLAGFEQQLAASMEGMLAAPDASDPQQVADAVLRLIETPTGQRPLRTIVDPHPEAVQAINDVCEQAQTAMLGAMQLGFMMQVAPRGQAS